MKTRSVVIHRLSIRSDPADGPVKNVTLTAHVSKGTYIRSLARYIALSLGTVGHLAFLRRPRAGPFSLYHAISLAKLCECCVRSIPRLNSSHSFASRLPSSSCFIFLF